MPSERHKRILQVVRLARRREDQATSLLRAWQQKLDAARQQLQQLRDYQAGYLQAPLSASRVELLQSRAAFLSQLADVISAQERTLVELNNRQQKYQQQWLLLHNKRKKLEEFGDRVEADAVRQLDKLWDKLCDELSSRPRSAD